MWARPKDTPAARTGHPIPLLVQVVHGFPPRENAGTEQVAHRSAAALRRRGWAVHTLAATREPGAPMYAEREEGTVSRLVNNAPFAALRRGGADPGARAWLERKLRELRPDVVHVHHLAFLDPAWVCDAPLVWTLHDAWAWCAAGGLLLRDGAPCGGPDPGCAACASRWVQDGPAVAAALSVAGRASRWIAPARLHRAWRALPAPLRAHFVRARSPLPPDAPALHRAHWKAFAARCAVRLAPSRWLADAAEKQGLGPVRTLPFGAAPGPRHRGGGPFLFLGTLAHHKGPDLVLAAHRQSGVSTPLLIHGPPGPDAAYVHRLPNAGPLGDSGPALASARALVLGSRWPENAPLVVLEARAAGCPVIAPASGGLPELVEHGVDGWLYPPGDVGALAAALVRAEHDPCPPVRPPPTLDAYADALLGVYEGLR